MADEVDRDRIRRHRVALTKNMVEPKEVLVYLNQWGVFTNTMKESTEELGSKREMVNKILDDTPKRGKHAVRMLYDALLMTEQTELADLMYPELKEDRLAGKLNVTGQKSEVVQSQSAASAFRRQMSNPPEEGDSEEEELPPDFPTEETVKPDIYKDLKEVTSRRIKNFATKPNKAYTNTSYPRGIALIINNVKFSDTKLSQRTGSDLDAQKLEKLFHKLDYNVQTKTNLSAAAIKSTLQEVASRQEHRSHHSFILVILSHGAKGKIYGEDGNHVEIEEILKQFNGINCPLLIDKPKLFFIQACQGEKTDGPGTQTKKENPDGERDAIEEITMQLENSRIQERPDAVNASVPTMADILLAMATTADYVSWRNDCKGTWFIQALAYVISKYGHRDSIASLMTKVNNLVAKAKTNQGQFKQVSECRSSLRKDFYFFPGLRNPQHAFGGGNPVNHQTQGQGQEHATQGQGHFQSQGHVTAGVNMATGEGSTVGSRYILTALQPGGDPTNVQSQTVPDERSKFNNQAGTDGYYGGEQYGPSYGPQGYGTNQHGSFHNSQPYGPLYPAQQQGPQFISQQFGPHFGSQQYGPHVQPPRYGYSYSTPQYGTHFDAPKYGGDYQHVGYIGNPPSGNPPIYYEQHRSTPDPGVPHVGPSLSGGYVPSVYGPARTGHDNLAHPVEETEAKYVFSG
ncbi:caspase-9-like [Lingula anatina]|uniref:Caspase-9-like n=1 Tax=Lingula anatina TaxID=7574 RepID=A0A1S3J529_LINAN|nr:caspase-9-like [Lingula anatina]|eukprot:XP_013405490.1 caspase-9-like [Lingula anatina]